MMQRKQRGESSLSQFVSSHGSALVVLFVGAAFILGGLQLGAPAGRFPIMLGGATVILALLEIVGYFLFRAKPGQSEAAKGFDVDERKTTAWVFATLALIYVTGMIVGSFVSTLIFCLLIERRAVWLSSVIAACNVFVIWFAFAYLANFELYQGVVF